MQQLNLHTNNLSGVIPSQLGNLTRLRIGGVDGNRGNIGPFGCVPAALWNATDADDLALAGANGISTAHRVMRNPDGRAAFGPAVIGGSGTRPRLIAVGVCSLGTVRV